MPPSLSPSSRRAIVGFAPDRAALAWGAIGGVVASFLIGLPMHALGMLVMGPAAMVGSSDVAVGWVVHLAAGVVFGAPYGLFVHARRLRQGIGLGLLWGLFVGVTFAWLGLFTLLGMPLVSSAGAIDVALHAAWGVVLGLVSAFGLRRGDPRAASRVGWPGAAP